MLESNEIVMKRSVHLEAMEPLLLTRSAEDVYAEFMPSSRAFGGGGGDTGDGGDGDIPGDTD